MAIYTIQAGDTLSKIAKKYNTTVDKLAQDNNIKNKNIIVTGNTLNVSDGFQKEEVPPMLKRPDEPVKTAAKQEPKKETAKPENKEEAPSTGEVIAKSILVPGYSTYKLSKEMIENEEFRDKVTNGVKTAATGAAVSIVPAFGIYKAVTSEPVKKAAGAAAEFVKDNKEVIGNAANETVKHSLLPGYTAYKIATSEPVKQVAGAVAEAAKDAAKSAFGFLQWLYR